MASLERLLSLIAYSPSRDQLWLVGDLVNRGPRSLDVLRWAMERDAGITCVLGNHDFHLLSRVAGAASEKKRDTLDDVLAARDLDRIVDWLRSRQLFHVDGSLAMVHGGLHPQWDVPTAQKLANEISAELRGPGWRAFLAQLGSGPPPRWHAKLGGGDRWRAILAYLTRARTLRADGRIEPDFDGHPRDAPPGCVPWSAARRAGWCRACGSSLKRSIQARRRGARRRTSCIATAFRSKWAAGGFGIFAIHGCMTFWPCE